MTIERSVSVAGVHLHTDRVPAGFREKLRVSDKKGTHVTELWLDVLTSDAVEITRRHGFYLGDFQHTEMPNVKTLVDEEINQYDLVRRNGPLCVRFRWVPLFKGIEQSDHLRAIESPQDSNGW